MKLAGYMELEISILSEVTGSEKQVTSFVDLSTNPLYVIIRLHISAGARKVERNLRGKEKEKVQEMEKSRKKVLPRGNGGIQMGREKGRTYLCSKFIGQYLSLSLPV